MKTQEFLGNPGCHRKGRIVEAREAGGIIRNVKKALASMTKS